MEGKIEMAEELVPKRAGHYAVESLQQKEAFELYYSLGSKRKGELVAKKFKRTSRTIYEWSRRFNWTERVIQRDIQVGKEVAHRNTSAVIDEKANYRKMIKLGMMEFVQDLREGKCKIKNLADFERMVKLDLTLMGEASEIVQNQSDIGLSEADREALSKYAVALKESLSVHYKNDNE